MKGIAHFAVGVAAASCFPRALEAGAAGQPLYFLLGGICGLLPDTLDFRFARFLYRHDFEAVLDPLNPDPAVIAKGMVDTISLAHATGRPQRVKLATARVSADAWQQYRVLLDVANRRVGVCLGPVVNTGGEALRECALPEERAGAWRPLPCEVRLEYAAETVVDIFDGPAFEMTPEGRTVVARFIPWHRDWSHGLLLAGAAALVCGVLFDTTAAGVAATAVLAHAVVDQLGQMGSNVLFPLSRRRVPGWRTIRSSDAMANFSAVWGACLLTFWNLARAAPWPHAFTFGRLFAWGLLAPLAAVHLLRRIQRKQSRKPRS